MLATCSTTIISHSHSPFPVAVQQKFRRLRDMSDDEEEEGDNDLREAHEKDMIADEIFMGASSVDDGEAAVDVPLHPQDDEEEEEEESGRSP